MFKQIILALGALVAATAFAAVDINKASQAELEAIKGIGPSMAEKMLGERKKAPFKDWNDLTSRVKSFVLARIDRALQLREFNMDLLFKEIEAALLLGIVLGEFL